MANYSSLRQFGIAITAKADKLPERADRIVRQIALAIDRTLVLATPVDTGRARANWQASLGVPASGTVPAGSRRGSEAVQQAEAVIATYQGGPGTAIFLTNNLPYIVPLNNGHSQQAPAGFVERSLAQVDRAARRAGLIT